MFSLKFDLLFPSFEAAKEMARKLNGHRNAPVHHPADPREIQRIRRELKQAREKVKAQMLPRRPYIM